jgi:hypothetical protein
MRVITDVDQYARVRSASPQSPDVGGAHRHGGFVPLLDSCSATNGASLNELVGLCQQRCRNVETERLGGDQVDDELELSRPHHR